MELVFLHGPAASGKLTTARALETVVGYPVFHNHLVVDTLTTVFPFGSEAFVRLREEFWLRVFNDAARARRSLTFTFTPENTVRSGFPSRAQAAVESAEGRVHFVRLLVSEGEQERRLSAESRHEFHKLTDLETLRRLRAGHDRVEQPPVDLEVDTDTSTAEETAAVIVSRFALKAEARSNRYADQGTGDRCREAQTF